jgi:hypothetical protein
LHADKLFMGRLAWMIIGFLLVEGSTRRNGLTLNEGGSHRFNVRNYAVYLRWS